LTQIAERRRGAADRLAVRLGRKLDFLSAFPNIGSPRPELGPGVRLLVEGST